MAVGLSELGNRLIWGGYGKDSKKGVIYRREETRKTWDRVNWCR